MATRRTRTCHLCEATCGLVLDVDDDARRVTSVRGDADDPFSRGYLCPKAHALIALHDDPDRLRAPLVRKGGALVPASWPEAFAAAIDGLAAIRAKHGADGVAIYVGNPAVHSLDAMLYGPVLSRALGTRQRYSASSADQLPKQVASALMFGGALTVPVPDVDRTDRLMILGANPLASNGSLMTAPDLRARLDAIRARGGKVIVIDPRRSETAARADEHHAIRPGGDAALLLAICHVLDAEGLVRLGAADGLVRGLDDVRAALARFAPERVAARVGLDAATIRRLAREHAAAERAACYGRIGTTCQEFGTLASWAVELVNVLTGNLDRPGGAMFTAPAVEPGRFRRREEGRLGRRKSRVRGLPEMFGELPVATLADELAAAGGPRALVTLAGNPVLSAPGGARLASAIEGLDLRIAIDPYVTATSRLADVILPPPSPLTRAHYDVALYHLAVRDVAHFSPPALARDDGQPAEWEILLTLAKGLMGMAGAPLALADDLVAREVLDRELSERRTAGHGLVLDAAAALAALAPRTGPERILAALLRLGPRGDAFGAAPGGLTLDVVADAPHGLDLGALEPRLPSVLRTADGLIDLAPRLCLDDLPRLEAALAAPAPELVLIGRRHLRSNNSWMHNLPPLAKGPARCTLLVHPDDAARLGLVDGGRARIASGSGEVTADVELSADLRPGVVSLPHGFGHDLPGIRLSVAAARPGVNVNLVSDPSFLDAPSANAAFNGVPVTVAPA